MNSSGPISLGGATAGQSINLEISASATAQVSLNDTTVRALAGVASGAITMPTNFYGKSLGVKQWWILTNSTYFNNLYPYSIRYDSSGNWYITWFVLSSQPWRMAATRYNSSNVAQWAAVYTPSVSSVSTSGLYKYDSSGNSYWLTIANVSQAGYVSAGQYLLTKVAANGAASYASYVNYTAGGGATGAGYYYSANSFAVGTSNIYASGLHLYSYISGYCYGPCGCYVCPIPIYTSTTTQLVAGWDSSGALQFIRSYTVSGGGLTSSKWDGAGPSVVDPSGNMLLTYFASTGGPSRFGILKIDSSGNPIWNYIYKFSSHTSAYNQVNAVDSSGNSYFGYGTTTSNFSFMKLDSSGTQQWAKRMVPFGSATNVTLVGLQVDSSGNVYALSNYSGLPVSSTNKVSLMKFNSSGTLQFERVIYQNATAYVTSNLNLNAYGINLEGSTITIVMMAQESAGISSGNPQANAILTMPTDGSFTGVTTINKPGTSNQMSFTIAAATPGNNAESDSPVTVSTSSSNWASRSTGTYGWSSSSTTFGSSVVNV
jgi:hypothetical protein